MIYGCLGICILIIIGLIIALTKKQKLDKSLRKKLDKEIDERAHQLTQLNVNYKAVERNLKTLTTHYEELSQSRVKEIDDNCTRYEQAKMAELRQKWSQAEKEQLAAIDREKEQTELAIETAQTTIARIQHEIDEKQKEYESLLAPIQQLEKEKSQRLFYTIQTPEEYQPDIEFLLTTVAAKVYHPDIISKLVWQEYVKPYLDDTCKRVGIEANPGIYKLTCLLDESCYIGKSTNVKKRIQDHFKSTVGIESIVDQAVHHAMLQTGLWNWTIEVLCYCDKDELNEKEKFYIDAFKSQIHGFNKKAGG